MLPWREEVVEMSNANRCVALRLLPFYQWDCRKTITVQINESVVNQFVVFLIWKFFVSFCPYRVVNENRFNS